MKKIEVINLDVFYAIAQIGHFDELDIGGAGIPMPRTTKKVDLAIINGVPSSMEVLNNVFEELVVQQIYLVGEIKAENPNTLTVTETRLPKTPISFIPHTEMRQELNNCHVFVRIGEVTPYANTLLESNVVF